MQAHRNAHGQPSWGAMSPEVTISSEVKPAIRMRERIEKAAWVMLIGPDQCEPPRAMTTPRRTRRVCI